MLPMSKYKNYMIVEACIRERHEGEASAMF